MITAELLKSKYNLQPHPEGGFYFRNYRSEFSTAIYYLLERNQCSAFHRIKSDELWHFYTGAGLHVYVIHPDGRGEILKLGNDISNGYAFQHVVAAGCWFAAKSVDENGFSFVGCTVAPGFTFENFELADRDRLMKEYPQHKEWIMVLT